MALLWAWLIATFVIIFFAKDLSRWHFLGWPLGFYLAGQGSVLIYLAIVGLYAWLMDREDARFKRGEHE